MRGFDGEDSPRENPHWSYSITVGKFSPTGAGTLFSGLLIKYFKVCVLPSAGNFVSKFR